MTTTETITFLRHFNRWRRGDDSIPQPQPGKATEAIDAACAHIERLERERDQWRECAEMFAKAIETLWRGDPSAAMEGDALAEFDRLKESNT